MEIPLSEELFRSLCRLSTLRGHGKSIDLDAYRQSTDHLFQPKLINPNRVKTQFGDTNRCLFAFSLLGISKVQKELLDVPDDRLGEVTGL